MGRAEDRPDRRAVWAARARRAGRECTSINGETSFSHWFAVVEKHPGMPVSYFARHDVWSLPAAALWRLLSFMKLLLPLYAHISGSRKWTRCARNSTVRASSAPPNIFAQHELLRHHAHPQRDH